MELDYRDLGHRVFWTFVQAFVGILVAGALLELDVTLLQAAFAAAVGDVLVVIKEVARQQLGRYGE